MKHFLIDSENVGDFWIPLLELPADRAELIVFYTKNSPHMSYDSLIKLKESDRTVTFIKCYEGTNALDFQLCSELGFLIAGNPGDEFIIVTNDTGYDAAVKYWRRKEYSVKRIAGKDSRTGSRRRGTPARFDVAAEVSAILHKLVKMPEHDDAGTQEQDRAQEREETGDGSEGFSETDMGPEFEEDPESEDEIGDEVSDDDEEMIPEEEDHEDDHSEEDPEEDEPEEYYGEDEPEEDYEEEDPDEDPDEYPSRDSEEDPQEDDEEDPEIIPDTDPNDGDRAEDEDGPENETVNGAEGIAEVTGREEPAEAGEDPGTKEQDTGAASGETRNVTENASRQEDVTEDSTEAEGEEPAAGSAQNGAEMPSETGEGFMPDPEEITAIVNCIGMENLAELHNQLIQFYGDNGKDVYQSLKSGTLAIEKKGWDKEEKFLYYCALIFRHSDEPAEALTEENISEFAAFLLGAENKRKNLNSLRYALLKHYGKEKGRRYYFMLKPYIKALNQM